MTRRCAAGERLRAVGCAAAVALLAGCSLVTPFDLAPLTIDGASLDDSGLDASDTAIEVLAEASAEDADDDHVEEPGPLTLVVRRANVTLERACDLDGDGSGDNSAADLGEPLATVFAMALNQQLDGFIEDNGWRVVVHVPWADDLVAPRAPDSPLIVFSGEDSDDPDDDSDDFSGVEEYLAKPVAVVGDGAPVHYNIDSCGEPLYFFERVSIERGELSGEDGAAIIPTVGPVWGARTWGTIERGSGSARLEYCAHMTIRDLGASASFYLAGNLSALEALVGGGQAFGMPTFPGLDPDIDLDGDGLERVVLDESSHVASCIDGDTTEIVGSDCWHDPRIADAFSVVMTLDAVAARFGGLVEGWESRVPGTCEDPPEESLWDSR